MNSKIYNIPAENMQKLHDRIRKLNKRADKLNCPAIEIKVVGEGMMKDHRLPPESERRIKFYEVEVSGTSPIIADWELVGRVYKSDGVTLVNTINDSPLPEQYQKVNMNICEHCYRDRNRKHVFVVRNVNDDEHKQVGRSCLKDFTGHKSPDQIANFASFLFEFYGDLDDDYARIGFGGDSIDVVSLDDYLAKVAAVVHKHGWTSRTVANDIESPTSLKATADIAWNSEEEPSDIDVINALDAIEWARSLDPSNDYLTNIKNIADSGIVTFKTAGYAASILGAKERADEKAAREKALAETKMLSQHIGAVKQRMELNVKVLSVSVSEGYYGRIEIIRMIDPTGNIIVWFANTVTDLQKGESYKVKATVKKHDEYQDTKQTIVNRLAVMEEVVA